MDADAALSSFDLGAKLAQRLREHAAERDVARRRLKQESDELNRLTRQAPKRPSHSRKELQRQAAELERRRTSQSLPLAQEKALLRQIAAAEREIRQHGEAERHQGRLRRKKADVEQAREALRRSELLVAEIETARAKADLGKRLGCLPSEVVSREHGFPMDKMRWVLGPDGGRIKAIEEGARVQIECDKIRGKFTLSGSQAGVEEAIAKLEIYTQAVDEEVAASADVIVYLLAGEGAGVLAKIKEDNPDVAIDVLATRIALRGHPSRLERARGALEQVEVAAEERLLAGREVALVVGAISAAREEHGVVAELARKGKGTTLRIVGPAAAAVAAMAAVDEMLRDNEELEEAFGVSFLLRNELLRDGGANIREFQRSLNQAIVGDRPEAGGATLTMGPKKEEGKLLLKCRRCHMERAKKLVTKKVEGFESNVISIDVPEDMVNVIIGKGGATINDLRKEGKGTLVEVDENNSGVFKVYSKESATRDAVRHKMEQIIAENQTGTVPIEKNVIALVLGDPGKEVRQACKELGCTLYMNSDDTQLVIKGTNEQIEEASKLVIAFLAQNHVAELEVAADDELALFRGGADSFLHKTEAAHDVMVTLRKGKNTLQVRGTAENVQAAVSAFKIFFHGGEGMAVCKFRVDDKAMGSVIGKGGSNIAKLEQEFAGVSLHVPREGNLISLRGPEDLVRQCRSRLVTTIATTRVLETVDIGDAQHGKLVKSNAIGQICRSTNTQLTLSKTSIKLRGFADDVRDAKINVTEYLTGAYQGIIQLEALQFGKVKRDSSHLPRIKASTGADVKLNNDAILISGKRAQVKKAKAMLLDFLEFLFPRQLQTVKIHRSLFKSVGDPGRLAQFSTETCATISLDRDLSSILVRSNDPDDCDTAVELVNALVVECQKLVAIMRFDTSDAWLLAIIIGKGGSNLKRIEKDTHCSIIIYKDEVTLVVSADAEGVVREGKIAVERVVEQARKECVFVDLPESSVSRFIGKGGAGIKKLAAEHDVQIEKLNKGPHTIKITGKEQGVASARAAVLTWLEEWEASHVGITIELEERLVRSIIGKGGETIRALEKDTQCKIDINRQAFTLTARGGTAAAREDAIGKIRSIIDEVKAKNADVRAAVMAKAKQEHADDAGGKGAEDAEDTVDVVARAKGTESAVARAKGAKDTIDRAKGTEDTVAGAKGAEDTDAATPQSPTETTEETGAKDRAVEFPRRSVDSATVAEKEFNPAIDGTEEGRQLYHWIMTGHVGDKITDIVYPDSDSTNDSGDRSAHGVTVTVKKDGAGNEVTYYQSESGFSVRGDYEYKTMQSAIIKKKA